MLGNVLQDTENPEDRTDKIFEAMDSNKDGSLSKKEFVEGCMKDQFLYHMLTADASGVEG